MTTPLADAVTDAEPPRMLDTLRKIKVPKSCDVLAEKLQEQILSGDYPPGASLPTERELVQATGLSRGSIRETLRILEAQGLVHTKVGRYGGSVVAQPSNALLASHINIFTKGRGVPLRALVEVRQALEPMVTFLAARNRTDEDLAELRRIQAALDGAADDDVTMFLEENANWHVALSVASHNELLCALTSSIAGLMIEVSRIENFATAEIRRLVVRAHRRILQAVETQDAEAARRRAERDVQAYARYLDAAVATAGAVAADEASTG